MDAIRVSSINSFLDCSAKFCFQYIEQVPTSSRIALAFGTSIHAALKKNYAAKIHTKNDIPLEELTSEFSDNYDAETQYIESFIDDDPLSFIKDAGIELLTRYSNEISPRIQPIIVEQKISVTFQDHPFTLSGTLDLIDEDNILVDHKTSRKQFKMMPAGYSRQISGYKFLANSINIVIKSQRVDLLIAKSAATNTTFKHLSIATDVPEFLGSFLLVTDGIQKGAFYPNRNSFLCNKKYCAFWNECENKYGGKVK